MKKQKKKNWNEPLLGKIAIKSQRYIERHLSLFWPQFCKNHLNFFDKLGSVTLYY